MTTPTNGKRSDAVKAAALRHLDELPGLKTELDGDTSAVVRKVAPGRSEYGTAPEPGAVPAHLPPIETASRQRLETYVDDCRSAVATLERDPDAPLTDNQVDGLEAIVLLMARPAILVQNGSFFPAPDPWGQPLEKHRKAIEAVMSSVGRIEVAGHPMFDWIGTGWRAAEDVVVTNRHVANEFARVRGAGWTFAPGMRAWVDYNEEFSAETPEEFRLTEIIGVHDTLDMALLRCEAAGDGAAALPPPLPIAGRPRVGDGTDVYVVGYPASDSRRNDPVEMQRIFAGIYNVKRLQPGKVRAVTQARAELMHDCSTLGGNSGSCVVDLETSQVIGLHFGGRYLQGNLAVALWLLADDPLILRAGIKFA
ncbi:trypsin-like serine peptidase [Saccharothrix deserti]|uniref:trypsin-like serine peptidase n=1 Tax=Saccharothrix deserti TaxID=2593674 RepID=UPI00131C4B08|nr:serine protease [Saccharothrix deserti]